MSPVDKLSAIVVTAIAAAAVYIAYNNEKLGGAILVGVAIATLLYTLLTGN
ncbi:hypothetical protein [Streptomyces sp. NPDC001068]|uniref:hypothetical protein n=1 Tax=Streptomyces sp. NPDC001068 TaxID=3364544 RepID=UPI003699D989